MVGGGIRSGVPRAQQPGEGFPAGDLRPVQVGEQRMKTVGLLPGLGRVGLLRMGDRDRRVHVDDQPGRQIRAAAGRPGPLAGRGPDRPEPVQMLGVDPVDSPPRGRFGGDLPEQLGLVPQRRQVRQRVPTIGDHHRQIGQHPPRRMPRRRHPVGVQQRLGPAPGQAGVHRQLPQQQRTGPRHQPDAIRADLDPPEPPVTLHLRGAFLWGFLGLSTSPFSPTGQALPCIRSECRRVTHERGRLGNGMTPTTSTPNRPSVTQLGS